MNELALFAGAGGGILGGHLLGWRTVCAVERDAYAAQVLAQRQNDGALPAFPIWSDVCSFDGKPWRGLVDVVSGGFPCQDISAAGNGTGIDGARSGLWSEMARIIGEVRPAVVYVENSPLLVGRGLAVALSDLAEMGYDAQWCIVSASDVGAPHQRDRCWIVAHDNRVRESQSAGQQQECRLGLEQCGEDVANACGGRRGESSCRQVEQSRRAETFSGSEAVADTYEIGRKRWTWQSWAQRGIKPQDSSIGIGRESWPAEPGMGRVANELAFGMDEFGAIKS
ncbi:DNA cytosine methyltransferase [Pseudomonas syringae]|uniref:DNA cytosine methyltransferase n=1 Tax=Pseudomonas syringae TaxID=317 RepID=UPI001F2FD4DE|nr:DNA cytosine methyltransferase [Pseudomonas syringae]MCF5709564.1 DNA cytosine methyltransferase [Pseudomonas syringae]